MTYQDEKELVREGLRAGTYKLATVQQRPYTFAAIRLGNAIMGVGFAKVNREDPWVPEYGERLAVEKAIASAAKTRLAKPECLQTGNGVTYVFTHHYTYDEVPDRLLDRDLNQQPSEWLEEIPF